MHKKTRNYVTQKIKFKKIYQRVNTDLKSINHVMNVPSFGWYSRITVSAVVLASIFSLSISPPLFLIFTINSALTKVFNWMKIKKQITFRQPNCFWNSILLFVEDIKEIFILFHKNKFCQPSWIFNRCSPVLLFTKTTTKYRNYYKIPELPKLPEQPWQ